MNELDKNFVVVKLPEKETSVDGTNSFISNIVGAKEKNTNTSDLTNLASLSTNRNTLFVQLDEMFRDTTVSAILNSYVTDTMVPDDTGKIASVTSSDPQIEKTITYLLETLRIDDILPATATNLYKYGEAYWQIYKESEIAKYFENRDLGKTILKEELSSLNKDTKTLKEDIKINISSVNDKFTNNIENLKDPSVYFELKKFGKTLSFIKAKNPEKVKNSVISNVYNFRNNDVDVFEPNRLVHGILIDNTERAQETVTIGNSNSTDDNALEYEVNIGKGLFTDVYPIWRKLSLLEDTIALTRITRSALTRVINVEVGGLSDEEIERYLMHIKTLFQQKQTLGPNGLAEYNSPSALENTIYNPIREGKGALSFVNEGGDYNITQIPDIEYYRDKFFGGTGALKQFFGFTGDSAGFDGGRAIAEQSIKYATNIIKCQMRLCRMIENALHILLKDRGIDRYIGKFKIRMIPPVNTMIETQADVQEKRISVIDRLVSLLGDISEDNKLLVIKELLSSVTQNKKISEIVSSEAERLKIERIGAEDEEIEAEEDYSGEDTFDSGDFDLGSPSDDFSAADVNLDLASEEPAGDLGGGELPSGADLGIDLTAPQ